MSEWDQLAPDIEQKLTDWMSAELRKRGVPTPGSYQQLAMDAVQELDLTEEDFPRAWRLAYELGVQQYGMLEAGQKSSDSKP